jgi:hypothetical protein
MILTRTSAVPSPRLRSFGVVLGVLLALAVDSASGAPRPPPALSTEAQEAVILMHWFSALAPPYAASVPPAPPPGPSTLCPPGNPACAPAPPALDKKYLQAFMPGDVAARLQAEFTRLRKSLPAEKVVKLNQWSVSMDDCSRTKPWLIVCKAPGAGGAHLVKIAPVLLNSILLQSAPGLLDLQDRLKSWGADPSSFDGSYQDAYGSHGLDSNDWNAVLRSWGLKFWPAIIDSIDFVIAQQMASVYLSAAAPLPANDPKVNQEAKTIVTAANGAYDVSFLIAVLGHASTQYDATTWGYEAAADVERVLAAIPAN